MRNQKLWISATLVILLLVMGVADTVLAQDIEALGSGVYVQYIVQPGDTIYKIADQHCTSWQEVFEINREVIGADPNWLNPGLVLKVIQRCTSGGGVYDRGPNMHANGTVNGNVYTVAAGDTMWSIARRFGLHPDDLYEVNGDIKIFAGNRIIIPGLGGGVAVPPIAPTPIPPQPQVCEITVRAGAPVYNAPGGGGAVSGQIMQQSNYTALDYNFGEATMWFYVDMDPGQGNYGWIEFSDVVSKSPGCP